jgi:hypothetical protein
VRWPKPVPVDQANWPGRPTLTNVTREWLEQQTVVGTTRVEDAGAALDFDPKPPNQWPGQRGDLYLPFLFMRAHPGDVGARPVVGLFWESPDILLLAGVDPPLAPPMPPQLGQTALAGLPNTIYAHVWNFGLSQAPNMVVEFYWCDPTLGIAPRGHT